MDNLENWNKLRTPPKWAIKAITGGRLSGKSDISPQWRIKAMTEVYGPVGYGWSYDILRDWTVNGSEGQVMVFVEVSVRTKSEQVWSEPVKAIGGDFLIIKEKSGLYCNDDAYKMATTDALGNCLKYFGVASDVYEGGAHDTAPQSKYSRDNTPITKTPPAPAIPVQGEVVSKQQANLIGQIEYDKLKAAVTNAGITGKQWLTWLENIYGVKTANKITIPMYAGILNTVETKPEQIKNFKPLPPGDAA